MSEILRAFLEARRRYHIQQRRLAALTLVLSIIVALGTSYSLSVEGLAQEADTFCGITEHTHSESCYAQPETEPAYVHTDECFDAEQGSLICTISPPPGRRSR